jgi:hypothetical protein
MFSLGLLVVPFRRYPSVKRESSWSYLHIAQRSRRDICKDDTQTVFEREIEVTFQALKDP